MPRTAKQRLGVIVEDGGKVVRPQAFQLDDAALVTEVLGGRKEACAVLFDRHAPHLQRVLVRVLGRNDELADALHDVFVQALKDLRKLHDRTALKAWLTRIAVHVARGRIRRATRRRWLGLLPPESLPEREAPTADAEMTQALCAAYSVLDALPADERIAFVLRFIDGMELKEAAAACNTSLATLKRRLKRAETRFVQLAAGEPALKEWLAEGGRWVTP